MKGQSTSSARGIAAKLALWEISVFSKAKLRANRNGKPSGRFPDNERIHAGAPFAAHVCSNVRLSLITRTRCRKYPCSRTFRRTTRGAMSVPSHQDRPAVGRLVFRVAATFTTTPVVLTTTSTTASKDNTRVSIETRPGEGEWRTSRNYIRKCRIR